MKWNTAEGRMNLQTAVNQAIAEWLVDHEWNTFAERTALQNEVNQVIRIWLG